VLPRDGMRHVRPVLSKNHPREGKKRMLAGSVQENLHPPDPLSMALLQTGVRGQSTDREGLGKKEFRTDRTRHEMDGANHSRPMLSTKDHAMSDLRGRVEHRSLQRPGP